MQLTRKACRRGLHISADSLLRAFLLFPLAQIWGTGLSGGERAVVLFNRHFDEALDYDNSSITLHWHHLGWETDMPVRSLRLARGLSRPAPSP